jgi:hypothetical protein
MGRGFGDSAGVMVESGGGCVGRASGGMEVLLRQRLLDKVGVGIDGGGDYEAVDFCWCLGWRVGRASGRMLLPLWI